MALPPRAQPRGSKAEKFAQVVKDLNEQRKERPFRTYQAIEQSEPFKAQVSEEGNIEVIVKGSSSKFSRDDALNLALWINDTFTPEITE